MKKKFETEIRIDGRELTLNHFVQEVLANVIVGFLETLKESEKFSKTVEIKIKKLAEQIEVNARAYS